MANHLETLAHHLEADPFFLACPLQIYSTSEEFDEEQLAKSLGCSLQTLVMLRLCRTPGAEPAKFKKDIERIASRFRVDRDVLADAVRRGLSLLHLRKATGEEKGTLMAARDAIKDPDD